jgi:hypothetical protein
MVAGLALDREGFVKRHEVFEERNELYRSSTTIPRETDIACG